MSAFEVKSDPRYTQGREFMKNKLYEDAIGLFQSLTEDCVSKYGEQSKETGLAYFEYGNALLTAEEENPQNDVLGNVEKKDANAAGKSAAPVEDEPVDDEEGEEVEGATEGEEGVDAEEDDQPEGDIQIAWECLDVARKIFDDLKDTSKDAQLLLSDVYIRLGDLLRFNDNNIDSIAEYSSALKIRNAVCEPHDSAISDAHYALAIAHTYNASEKDLDVNPLKEKQSAVEHYKKCRQCMELWMKQPNHTEDEVKDKQEVIDILTETIDALEAEIKEQIKDKNGSSSSSSGAGSSAAAAPIGSSTTTIGFGSSSATGGAGASSSAAVNAAPVTMLVSKKKRPATEVAAAADTAKASRTM